MKSLFILGVQTLLSTAVLAQEAVFPLNVGDRWLWTFAYNGHVSYVDFQITQDSIMPNGKRYVAHFMDSWICQQGDSVFMYGGDSRSDILLYDFTATVGDTVLTDLGHGTFAVVLDSYNIWDWFGASRRVWNFHHEIRYTPDTETWDTIADSIGIVSRTRFPGSYDLLGAYVNGRTYGTLSEVSRDSPSLSGLSLTQNHPNPFNPTTTIEYDLPTPTQVSLKVYNVIGQEVAELVSGEQTAGHKSVRFDATGLPSGVYLYRLTAGDCVATMKLILMR
jgi:hypothetical protein